MDPTIDLTLNRDFRHKEEPRFKDSRFFNFIDHEQLQRSREIADELYNADSIIFHVYERLQIVNNNGKLKLERPVKRDICECCGRRIVAINSMLCDKCDRDVTNSLRNILRE